MTADDDAPGFVVSLLTGSCSLHAPRTMLRSVLVAVSRNTMTLSDSLPMVARAAVAQIGSADASPVPHTSAVVSRQGIDKYPLLSTTFGASSSSPKGEVVIMIDALRATPFSGAFWVVSQCLMQQRRAVRATVREERDSAAGDEELATKSRASSVPQSRKRYQGDGASGTDRREWSGARSTVTNPQGTGDQRGAPGY